MRSIFQRKPVDIIGITEMKLTGYIPQNKLEIDEYESYRADRKILGNKSGSDCALYINDNVNVEERSNFIPQYMIGICGIVIFIKIHDMFVSN